MLYSELLNEAKDIVIDMDDINLKYYLRPDYRQLLYVSNLTADNVTDFPGITDDIIAQAMKLQVQARNVKADKTPLVVQWLTSVITSTIQPIEIDEENQLFKNIVQYMKMNNEVKNKEKELAAKQQQLNKKAMLKDLIPGMSLSKAKP